MIYEVIPQEGPSIDEQIFVRAECPEDAVGKINPCIECKWFRVRGVLFISEDDLIFKVSNKTSFRKIKVK